MVFKKWFDAIGHEIDADENVRSQDNNYHVNLVNFQNDYGFEPSLSPLTRNLLNTWTNVLNTSKNLILNFPDNKIMTIPLLAYIYSKITSKSTLIITSNKSNNNLSKFYNQHYQLMRYKGSEHLYKDIPIGFIKGTQLEYVPHLIHARTDFQYSHKDKLRENLISSDKPKVLLNSENNFT